MAQLVSALNYIHARGIVHRDVKLSNLLLSKNLDLFLGDFGSVKQLLGAELCQTFIGTPTIMSPEVIAGQQYDQLSDCWAAGCCLYELVERASPFSSKNFIALMNLVQNAKYAPMHTADSRWVRLVHSLLVVDPAKRLDSFQLCQEFSDEI